MKSRKELTKAEEQAMNILWELDRGFINEVVAEYPTPRPAYTTVASIIHILEKKGYVSREAFGNSFRYTPLVSKVEYAGGYLKRFVDRYFSSSYKNMVSALSNQEDLSTEDMEEIVGLLNKKLKDKSKGT